jgi:uncharacterized delta-60 repeat protein
MILGAKILLPCPCNQSKPLRPFRDWKMTMKSFSRQIHLSFAAVVACFLLTAAASAQITVSSTTPNAAAQGTINLNVTVSGKGFKKGAQSQWFVTGTTNPGGVTVNSTAFVRANELTANITVASDAVISSFDVVVTNTDGRTGKGTELFAVKSQTQSACTADVAIQPAVISGTCSLSGCLDVTFGNSGETIIDINPPDFHSQTARSIAVQPDGRIVAAGPAGAWGVARYNPDGSLDTSFNSIGYGVYLAADAPNPAIPYGMALQTDGRIVITGTDNYLEFAIGRINADGSPDTTFGGTGFVSLNLSKRGNGGSRGAAVAVQADAKIVATDWVNSQWVVLRFLPNGTLDTTFGSGGIATIQMSGSASVILFQTVAGEQRIVVGGNNTSNSTGSDFALARLRSNGQLDATFGGNGTGGISTDFCGGNDSVTSLAFDSSGNIVASGGVPADTAGYSDLGVARYTSTGLLDASFGRSGKLNIAVPYNPPNALAAAMSVDGLGRIVLLGGQASSTPGASFLMVARLNPDGTPDTTFAGGAIVHPELPSGIGAGIQSDGKFLLGSQTPASPHGLFTVIRVLP